MSACSTFRVATGRDLLRWSICFVAILSLHGAVAAALLMKPVEGDTFDSTIAVDVDSQLSSNQGRSSPRHCAGRRADADGCSTAADGEGRTQG